MKALQKCMLALLLLAGMGIFSGCSPSNESSQDLESETTFSDSSLVGESAPAAVAYGATPADESGDGAVPILEAEEEILYNLESEPGAAYGRSAAAPADSLTEALDETPAETLEAVYSMEISEAVAVSPVINTLSLPKDSLEPLNLPENTIPGPMANGQLVTLTPRSESNFSYFQEDGSIQKAYPLEVAIFDCSTKSAGKTICTVEAMDPVQTAVSLDGEYAYLFFTPLANTIMLPLTPSILSSDPIAWEEYNIRLYRSSQMVLQINMKNGSLKQFPIKISGVLRGMTPLGNSNLLLEYTSDPAMSATSTATVNKNKVLQAETEARSEADLQHYEYMDLLDLTTGKLISFYVKEPKSMMKNPESKFVEMSLVSASEERVYFKTTTLRGGNISFGYRVYDTAMNFIDGKEVDMLPQTLLKGQEITAYMSVQRGKLAYCISGLGAQDGDWYRYYQFTPVVGGYDWEPYSFATSGQPLYTVNPRLEPLLDYDLLQYTDEGGSWLSISNPTTGVQYLAAINSQLEKTFSPPEIGVWQPVGNYDGDFLVKGSSEWFFISREALEKAIGT